MTPANWAALAVSIMTIIAGLTAGIRFLVKHYLSELKPNGGSSVKDQINRLESSLEDQRIDSLESRNRQEAKLDDMYKILLEHIAKTSK